MRGSPAAALLSSELPAITALPPAEPAWAGPYRGPVPGRRWGNLRIAQESALAGGQLGAGLRASPTNVGYLGNLGDLTTLNPGGSAPSGSSWDVNTLIIASSGTFDHYLINGGVVVTGSNNPTVTNCRIIPPAGEIYCIAHNGTGTLTISDCTMIGNSGGANPQVNAIASDGFLVARRCHVTNSGDGIHWVSNGALISQCYVGPLRFTDEAQHCDGMQVFQDSVDGTFTLEHCYVAQTLSTIGTPMNSALTYGPPSATGPLITPTINNNYFAAGLYHLRNGFQTRNAVVTNNDFGPLGAGEFGLVDNSTGNTYATWSNNRDSGGNPISSP